MEWISVKDQLPEGLGDVLLFSKSKVIYKGDLYDGKWRVIGYWDHNGKEWVSRFKHEDITHWMPLPEPPKELGS